MRRHPVLSERARQLTRFERFVEALPRNPIGYNAVIKRVPRSSCVGITWTGPGLSPRGHVRQIVVAERTLVATKCDISRRVRSMSECSARPANSRLSSRPVASTKVVVQGATRSASRRTSPGEHPGPVVPH
jgi:hypothetical protein